MGELLVRSLLTNLDEAQLKQRSDHLPWLQDREAGHPGSGRDRLNPGECGFHLGSAILQQHRDDLAEVLVQFVQTAPLRVSAWEPRHVADEQAGLEVLFDHDGELSHGFGTLG